MQIPSANQVIFFDINRGKRVRFHLYLDLNGADRRNYTAFAAGG